MKYDIIIPMGCFCAAAQALKSVKKRSRSLPFDWIIPLSFERAVRFLETGFEGFFEKEDLKKFEKDTKKHVGYINTRTNILFLHEFTDVSRFDEEYVLLREKYDRRIKRIYQTINDSKNILYLHIFKKEQFSHTPAEEELEASLAKLREMYPGRHHRLLFINLADAEAGRTGFEKRKTKNGDIDCYDCYRDQDAEYDENFPDYVYYKKNVESVLNLYKVRKNAKDILKKISFKILDAVSRIIPNQHIRGKIRMWYKEYK